MSPATKRLLLWFVIDGLMTSLNLGLADAAFEAHDWFTFGFAGVMAGFASWDFNCIEYPRWQLARREDMRRSNWFRKPR